MGVFIIMEFNFEQGNKELNQILVTEYGLKCPEKITYIDKVILWSRIKFNKTCKIKESKDGVSVIDLDSGEKLSCFKRPEIDMD